MDIIKVTDDISIELDVDSWRLVKDENRGVTLVPLVEYNGIGLRLHPAFAGGKDLGRHEIPVQEVVRVTLGWEPRTQGWHLGVLLSSRGAIRDTGELQWCGLATWQVGQYQDASQSMQAAQRAGEGLARLLNCPFHIIEPDRMTAAPRNIEATQPSMRTNPLAFHSVSLSPLPIDIGDWGLHASGEGLVMRPTRRWKVARILRMMFFLVVLVIYVMLGVGSETSGLARVTPEWLPLAAFGMAILLGYGAAENFFRLLLHRQIVIDEHHREVRSERALTRLVDWRVPYDEVEYILVSQDPVRSEGRRSREDPMQVTQEAWVHIYAAENFILFGEMGKIEGKSWDWEVVRRHNRDDHRRPIDLTQYDTPLHHAVRQIADKLNVEAYLDIH